MNNLNDLYIVIDHTNGEIDEIYLIKGNEFANHCSKVLGYLVYRIDLNSLEVFEI